MARVRPVLALIVLLTAEGGAVAGLWELGDRSWAAVDVGQPARWLAATSVGDALAAVLRLVALAVAAYLLCSTAAYVLARCSGVPAAVRAVRWVTLPTVRRVADRAVAVALTAGTALGGPAVGLVAAAEPPVAVLAPANPAPAWGTAPAPLPGFIVPPAPLVPSQPPAEPAPVPEVAASAVAPELASWVPGLPRADRTVVAAGPPAEPSPAPMSGPATHVPAALVDGAKAVVTVVEAGDNLWALSAARLAEATGRTLADLSEREVHAYWVTVLAANRDRLPMPDLDLVHPGDHVTLPPLGA